ncbi:TPA: DUF1270 family protein, partial [Staphylococcus aureus]|nr:DUF1270 family protein [Staphylococcus aureus]
MSKTYKSYLIAVLC